MIDNQAGTFSEVSKYKLDQAIDDLDTAKLMDLYQDRVATAKSLFGILPQDVNLEDTKAERLEKFQRINKNDNMTL